MNKIYESAMFDQVKLLDSEIKHRFTVNEELLLRYDSKELLRSYYFEAGLWKDNSERPELDIGDGKDQPVRSGGTLSDTGYLLQQRHTLQMEIKNCLEGQNLLLMN